MDWAEQIWWLAWCERQEIPHPLQRLYQTLESADNHIGKFYLTLMPKFPYSFESTNSIQEFISVMHSSPFAITDHVKSRLFLKPNGEDNHFIHSLVELIFR